MNLLWVDDNAADANLFKTLALELVPDAQIHLIGDGEAALEFLRLFHREIDAVLLDLDIPKHDGFEVLREMEKDEELRALPVFVVSSATSAKSNPRLQTPVVRGVHRKPPELDDVQKLVSTLLLQEIPETLAELRNTRGLAVPPAERASGEGFRLLVEAVRDYAIFMLDVRGYILTWNEGAQRIKQYAPAEIIGRHFSTFYLPEAIRSGHPAQNLRLAEQNGRFEEEDWRLRKDGSRFWANVTITAIYNRKGALVGFGKVTRDTTERRRAESALRESEERFRLLVEGVKDYAIFMLDATGHIASWNKGSERIKGYRAEEVLGKHFSLFYTEDARARRHPEQELKVAKESGRYEEEGIRVRKDGSLFWANVSLTALHDKNGELKGFSKITRDITERKKAERDIQQTNAELERRVVERTRELERSTDALKASKRALEEQQGTLLRINADLRQFAFAASHDLQEPLRTVVAYLQLVQRKAAGRLEPEELQCIRFAVEGALRMRSLVQGILSYARLERESVIPDTEVSIEQIVGHARAQLAQRISQAGALVELGPLPKVRADSAQLLQLFQNLLTNALVYNRPGVSPRIWIGSEDRGDGFWTFCVRDNGIGIAPEYADRIFDMFTRLNADREKYPGTGIGLAICRKVVERHGGKIWVQSRRGEGTTFFFTLPK